MKPRVFFMSAAVPLVAACGGGGGANVPSGPLDPITETRNTPVPTVNYNSMLDAYQLQYGSGSSTVLGNAALDYLSFDAGGTASGEMVFRAESSVSRVDLTRDINDETGVTFARLTETVLPDSGVALYEGDYVAIVSNVNSEDVVYFINGDAALEADFATSSVNGQITDRVLLAPSGDEVLGATVGDLTLGAGTMNSEGVFSGTTSGGSIDTGFVVTTAQAGTHSGLLAGALGQRAVGGLDLIHDRSGALDDYVEEGAFSLVNPLAP